MDGLRPTSLPVAPFIDPVLLTIHSAEIAYGIQEFAQFLPFDCANESLVQFVVTLHTGAQLVGHIVNRGGRAKSEKPVSRSEEVLPARVTLFGADRPINKV